MSVHFELWVSFDLKLDTSAEILDTLKYMMGEDVEPGLFPLQDEFDDPEAWRGILSVTIDDIYRFAGDPISSLRAAYRYNLPSNQGGAAVYFQTFTFHSEIKDDGFPEYMLILDWLAPYSETQGHIGFWRSEYDLSPYLIYFKDGKVFDLQVTQDPYEDPS